MLKMKVLFVMIVVAKADCDANKIAQVMFSEVAKMFSNKEVNFGSARCCGLDRTKFSVGGRNTTDSRFVTGRGCHVLEP